MMPYGDRVFLAVMGGIGGCLIVMAIRRIARLIDEAHSTFKKLDREHTQVARQLERLDAKLTELEQRIQAKGPYR